tara:strand:+ start:642 stop:941 length:300 start_codon:yes stop_codon:yes gene_type:complete
MNKMRVMNTNTQNPSQNPSSGVNIIHPGIKELRRAEYCCSQCKGLTPPNTVRPKDELPKTPVSPKGILCGDRLSSSFKYLLQEFKKLVKTADDPAAPPK